MTDGAVVAEIPDGYSVVTCSWWLLCPNVATTVEPHPVLGYVPICGNCLIKLRRIEGDESFTK